jgi:hypothetical protein
MNLPRGLAMSQFANKNKGKYRNINKEIFLLIIFGKLSETTASRCCNFS